MRYLTIHVHADPLCPCSTTLTIYKHLHEYFIIIKSMHLHPLFWFFHADGPTRELVGHPRYSFKEPTGEGESVPWLMR